MKIQSSQATAGGHASALAASAHLMIGHTVAKDTSSLFETNTLFQTWLDQEESGAHQLSEQTLEFVARVQRTAQEFATTDSQIAAQIQFWQSTETLNKASLPTRKENPASSIPLSATETLQKAGTAFPTQ